MGKHGVVCALVEGFLEGEEHSIFIQGKDDYAGRCRFFNGDVLPSLTSRDPQKRFQLILVPDQDSQFSLILWYVENS